VRLYSSPISPFAARVRAALYFKGLPFDDLGVPTEGLKSSQFLAMNPMGRIPVLLLDDDTVIPESETILQYLEDEHPQPSLMPATSRERALVRTAIRVTDNYITPPTTRLFPHLDPTQRNPQIVADEMERVNAGLRYLEHYLADGAYVHGQRLTLADCCVFPSVYLCAIIGEQLGAAGILESAPRVAKYFGNALKDPHLGRVHEEIAAALRAYRH
jgi:glutathione S-transferase